MIIRNYKHNISHANIISAFFKEDIESYNERVFNKFRKNEKLFKMVKYIIWNEGVELSEDKIVEFILDKRNQIIEADILASFYFLSKDNILKVHSFHQNNQALLGYLFESKLRKEEKEELFSLIPKNKKLKDFLNRGLLHLSAKYGNLEMVKYLKRKGFNDYLDKERHSAYDIAKMNNYHTLAFYIKNN